MDKKFKFTYRGEEVYIYFTINKGKDKNFYSYKFNIPKDEDFTMEMYKEFIDSAFPKGSKHSCKLLLYYYNATKMKDKAITVMTDGTVYKEFNELENELEAVVNDLQAKYDEFNILALELIELHDKKEKNIKGSADAVYVKNYNNYTIINAETKTNCLYTAFIIAQCGKMPNNLNDLAKHLKLRVGNTKPYADENDIVKLAIYKKCNIYIHAEDLSIKKIFKGSPIACKNRTKLRPDVHIVHGINHFLALLETTSPKIEHIQTLNRLEMQDYDELQVIKKHKMPNQYKTNYCVWDIEASPNDKNNFKSYAVGFYDGVEYKSWFGLDCLHKFKEYVYENRAKYNGHVFYAHNSGKFDTILMLNEVLLCDDKFIIKSDVINGWVDQDGRLTNVIIGSEDNVLINFRDSYAMLPASLKQLCKDFKVLHSKKDDVDHEKITLNNYHEFSQLPEYLEYDCKGLYEVLHEFNKVVWKATSKKVFNTEKYVRSYLEKLYNKKFIKTRPNWLVHNGKRLELDMYNSELKIAVEYNGEQHYKLSRFNKHDKNILQEIQDNDKAKKEICKSQGIKLIVVPFFIARKNLDKYICKSLNVYDELTTEDINSDNSHDEYGINITDCLTGASLAKKFYYLRYYKCEKYPIYTLTKEIDNYIRSSYFGGRVEIFHFGKVKCDKLYYYDFTSLYPSMACKDLPFDKPEFTDNITNIKDFFGFIRCKATTINKNIKPLHAIKENHKLLFRHLENDELILFSEEIKLGLDKNQYKYEFLDGYKFDKEKILKEMNENVFKLKSDTKKLNQDALSQAFKIILNSSYGFWGFRSFGKDTIKIYNKDEAPVYKYLDSGKLKDIQNIGKYTLLRVVEDLEIKDFNVAIASAITSYARMELFNLITDIEKAGGEVYMCDTDSIICNIDLNDYPEIKARYQPDGKGEFLGSLKNELNDKLKKMKIEIEENKNYYFDSCYLNGAKYYSLQSKKYNVEINKCKGYSQSKQELKHEQYSGKLEQDVKQFLCGKNGMINNNFNIELRTINKVIKPQYNKGKILDSGVIIPLEKV